MHKLYIFYSQPAIEPAIKINIVLHISWQIDQYEFVGEITGQMKETLGLGSREICPDLKVKCCFSYI